MFLMATSAIGPGFITQTTLFTAQLGAAFAFAILISILVDIALQLNVWRVIGVSGLRAPELGNRVLPGAGHVLTFCVVVGGFVFNVGNVAGCGLGLDALAGLDPRWGGALSALLAIGVFVSRRAGIAMDRIVIALGFVMIAMTAYVAFVSRPPVGLALRNAVLPDAIDVLAITTLVGGTVGGYITYAGAHRLLDAGVQGREAVAAISRA
jgi:Mn2+/Fe2+ NRAMP family transporter